MRSIAGSLLLVNKSRSFKPRILALSVAISAAIFGASTQAAQAGTRCVNPGGNSGCYHSIGAAVAAASWGDTIKVWPGTYDEQVTIHKSLSLIGQNYASTTINAMGKRNGILIGNTSHVNIAGLTVQNANTSGIWVTNSSFVTVSKSRVRNNDKSLTSSGTCPALAGTVFEGPEGEDCGEGIFLSGVSRSIVSKNVITENAGGILITDDTGPTHHNVIAHNWVIKNAPDCGITLPSHSGAGVFANTITENESLYNGAAGVGIFAPGPGSKSYANVVVNNRLVGNGLPGVTMHNHAAPGVGGVPANLPPPIFNNNVIVGNLITDNAKDDEDAATPGPTGINIYSLAPMKGTVISQNTIRHEKFGVVVNIPTLGTFPAVQVQLNNFAPHEVGLLDVRTAVVEATQNWWGCPNGPGSPGCATVQGSAVLWSPWLTAPF